mmetsp:Transcript_22036/g.58706  ORF Transcript_22036/g.58706 Transcript_22036/m.58706 type:complete len:232 (-) Transcript_22036:1375-2070(-)
MQGDIFEFGTLEFFHQLGFTGLEGLKTPQDLVLLVLHLRKTVLLTCQRPTQHLIALFLHPQQLGRKLVHFLLERVDFVLGDRGLPAIRRRPFGKFRFQGNIFEFGALEFFHQVSFSGFKGLKTLQDLVLLDLRLHKVIVLICRRPTQHLITLFLHSQQLGRKLAQLLPERAYFLPHNRDMPTIRRRLFDKFRTQCNIFEFGGLKLFRQLGFAELEGLKTPEDLILLVLHLC